MLGTESAEFNGAAPTGDQEGKLMTFRDRVAMVATPVALVGFVLALGIQLGRVNSELSAIRAAIDPTNPFSLSRTISTSARRFELANATLFRLIGDLHSKDRATVEEYRRRLLETTTASSPLSPPLTPSAVTEVKPSQTIFGAFAFRVRPGCADCGEGVVAVRAMADGEVVEASTTAEQDGTFCTVGILHGYGYRTFYGRLKSCPVRPGQQVRAGQPIGVISPASEVCLRVWMKGPGSNSAIEPSLLVALLPPFQSLASSAP